MLKDIIERQNKVLEIIISSYVENALPVGSRAVSKIVGLSSATIRSIMADLEDMKYITHPHTSAGRIPTDKGYRCYVESLMQIKDINRQEMRQIEKEYRAKRRGIEDIIKKTAQVLASITHHTGIVLLPKFRRPVFKRIDLLSIGRKKTLVVLIAATGIVKNFIIDTKEDISKDLDAIVNLLNSDYNSLTLEDIKQRLIIQLRGQRDSFRNVIKETSDIIESMMQLLYEDELHLGGTSCLLSQPEFGDAGSAKSILQIFEGKASLSRLLEEDLQKNGMAVYIGRENKFKDMQQYSVLTSGYKIRDELVGRLGIIGPTRMEYSHLIPVVNYISETVTRTLSELVE